MVAVPIGFVITVLPAYGLRFIRRSDVLDVFVGSGLGPYERLAAVTVMWAFLITVLVTAVLAVVSRQARQRAG
jgi:hypothetical protein